MNNEILERRKNINRGFRKLEVWVDAVELYVFVKEKVRGLQEVPLRIRSQIEDSIFSCHSNIAEGYGRRGLKENIQFNTIALASLAENYSQLYSLLSGSDIDKEWFEQYDSRHYKVENKLISYNKSQIELLKKNSDWRNDYLPRQSEEKLKSSE